MTRLVLTTMLLAGCGFAPVEEFVEPTREVAPVVQLPQPLEELRTVLRDETTPIDLVLNEHTVFCSAIGYGASFLKVSVPQLDALAHFDHRVEEAGLPCAAVGACDEALGPDTLLQGAPGVERVQLRVVLTEVLRLDFAARACTRQLLEDVEATVRGVTLRHHEEDRPSPMAFELCALAVRLAGEARE